MSQISTLAALARSCSSKTSAEIHDLSTENSVRARILAVLGLDAIAVAAEALECSRARFANPEVQEVVIAIVEGLEALNAAGTPRDEWPPRWRRERETSVCPDLRTVWVGILGRPRLTARLALAIGRSPDLVARALSGASSRGAIDLSALAEVLDTLTAHGIALPPRWQALPTDVSTRSRVKIAAPDGQSLRERIAKVLPGRFPSAQFARGLGKHPDSMSRWLRGSSDSKGRKAVVPESVAAVVELLETLQAEGVPRERWPERWRSVAD